MHFLHLYCNFSIIKVYYLALVLKHEQTRIMIKHSSFKWNQLFSLITLPLHTSACSSSLRSFPSVRMYSNHNRLKVFVETLNSCGISHGPTQRTKIKLLILKIKLADDNEYHINMIIPICIYKL